MHLHPDIKDDHLQEVAEFVTKQDEFQIQIRNIKHFVDFPVLLRLNNWFHFFNENYFKSPGIFTYTVLALMDASQSNQLFRTQTRHEFEISLSFYELIINSSDYTVLNEKETAKFLLNISLMYGKYPGMIIRSTRRAIKILENGTSEIQLHELFKSLFVKYEDPYFLSKNINKLGLVEMDALMHILQGNNIRNFDKLPFTISKKESFLLLNRIPENLKFEENVLEKGIICSKLLLSHPDKNELLYSFLFCSKTFQFQVFTFYNDIDYWKKAFSLMCNVDWKESLLSMQEYVDYFEYKKYTENPDYSLSHRTVNSITQSIKDWHEAAEYERKKELIDLNWNGVNKDKSIIKHKERKFSFKEITSGHELFKESDEMKHCVFSYINNCITGYTSIWSMKKEVNSTYQSYVTIEVDEKKITQVAGKRNRIVDQKDYEIIEIWAKKMNYSIETY